MTGNIAFILYAAYNRDYEEYVYGTHSHFKPFRVCSLLGQHIDFLGKNSFLVIKMVRSVPVFCIGGRWGGG